jgi:poxvirus D5 protein-like
MFYTKPFDTKCMVVVAPCIIRAIDFMSNHTNVPLKNVSDMREHIRDIVTEYYQECYAQALLKNNGREPKSFKITTIEYVLLLLNIVPLARIERTIEYEYSTKTKSVVCIYDFDEESLTYGRYVPAQELMMDIIRDIEPFKTASHYQHTYKVLTAFVPHKEENVIETKHPKTQESNSVFEFLDEFLPRFKWEVLPTKFLYKLYESWMSKDNENEKPVKKSVFIKYSADFFKDQPGWSIRLDQDDKITVGTRMDADEPLITEYKLIDYMDPNYKGTDPKAQRAFTRPKTTRGYAKLKYSTA